MSPAEIRKLDKVVDHADTVASFRRDFTASIARAAVAHGRARFDRSKSASDHAKDAWPHDKEVQLLTRAASPPTDMTSGASLIQIALAVLPLLQPNSAAAALFQVCLSVAFDRNGAISVPNIPPVVMTFVADGMPKPVLQGVSSASRLDPHKIAGIVVATMELYEQPAAAAIIGQLLAAGAG